MFSGSESDVSADELDEEYRKKLFKNINKKIHKRNKNKSVNQNNKAFQENNF